MITEQELKERCTPEFIKWMCEFAEGFEWKQLDRTHFQTYFNGNQIMGLHYFSDYFFLLIHRAVEGWNKLRDEDWKYIFIRPDNLIISTEDGGREYPFKDYQSQSLTQAECAMLHCLQDIFSEQI